MKNTKKLKPSIGQHFSQITSSSSFCLTHHATFIVVAIYVQVGGESQGWGGISRAKSNKLGITLAFGYYPKDFAISTLIYNRIHRINVSITRECIPHVPSTFSENEMARLPLFY